MNTIHRRPRRLPVFVAALLSAVAITSLGGIAAADPLPLSPAPSADLTCATNGTSTLTIHWGAGDYGAWLMSGGILGDLSGPGGSYAAPTDETFVVPAGWEAQTSTFRLNQDAVGDTSYNQTHVDPTGAACPFSTTVVLTYSCTDATLQTTIGAGHVTTFKVFDDTTGDLLVNRAYPKYNLLGVLVDPVPVGPVTISAPVANTVTRVRVEVTVDNTVLTAVQSTNCTRGCAKSLDQWANANLADWPLTSVKTGSTTQTASAARTTLRTNTSSIQTTLRQQLIAAKLNQARGASYPGLQALIDAADASLTAHPSDSGTTSAQRSASTTLRGQLEQFNRGLVPGVPACRHC